MRKCAIYNMSLAFITVCGLLVFVLYQTFTEVKSPGSKCSESSGPLPLSAAVAGCAAAPCVVRQGEDAVLHITFIPQRNTTTLKTVATAYLNTLGITIPIPCDLGKNADTCSFLANSSCPVQAGELINYTLRLAIPTAIPSGIAPTVEFSIVDEHRSPVTCVRVPIQVEACLENQTQDSILDKNTTELRTFSFF